MLKITNKIAIRNRPTVTDDNVVKVVDVVIEGVTSIPGVVFVVALHGGVGAAVAKVVRREDLHAHNGKRVVQ